MKSLSNNYTQLHAVIYVYLYVALYGDKKKSLDEIDEIKRLIKDWDNSGNVDIVYKETKEWFEADKATNSRKTSFETCINYLKENLDRFHKPGMIEDLMSISKADGSVTEGEAALISQIAQEFGIKPIAESTSKSSEKETESTKITAEKLFDVIVNIGETNRIGIIQLYSKLNGCDLHIAKQSLNKSPAIFAQSVEKYQADQIKELCTNLGAQAIVVDHGQEAKLFEITDESCYNVVLENSGYNKLAVLKMLSEIKKISLQQAKDLIEDTPVVLAKGIDYQSAKSYKLNLESAGANVTLTQF